MKKYRASSSVCKLYMLVSFILIAFEIMNIAVTMTAIRDGWFSWSESFEHFVAIGGLLILAYRLLYDFPAAAKIWVDDEGIHMYYRTKDNFLWKIRPL